MTLPADAEPSEDLKFQQQHFPVDEDDTSSIQATDTLDLEWQGIWLRQQAKNHRQHMRIAYELAADAQMSLMHVTGLGWFQYEGSRWVVDEGDKAATNAVMKTIRRLASDAIADKELYNDLVKSQTASGAKGVLGLAASLPGIAVKAAELDADPYILNTPSGSLNLKTFELYPHDPADRLTRSHAAPTIVRLRVINGKRSSSRSCLMLM